MFLEINGKIVDPQNRNLDLKELTKIIPSSVYFGEWKKRSDGKSECSFRCMAMFFPWYNNIFADLDLENANNDITESFNTVVITEDLIDKESFGLLVMMSKQDDIDSFEDSFENEDKDAPDFVESLVNLKYEGGTMTDYVEKHMKDFEDMAKELEGIGELGESGEF